MRIYNISKENSLKSLFFDIAFIMLITIIPLIACIFDMNILTFAGLFIMVIIDILFVINLFRKRNEYLNSKSFHNILYYVEFEPSFMRFCAKDEKGEQKYVIYEYTKIEGANIILETFDSSTTRKHYTGIRDISVNFYTTDGDAYVLHSYHLTFGGNLRTIYNIISFCRKMKNFTYTLTGTGDQSEIKEKLDYYIKHNRKLHVEPSGRKDMKTLAILIFLWGCAVSIVSLLPALGYKATIISSITFGFIAYLIYYPVILDKKHEQDYQ